MSEKNEIVEGDVVYLKSGGPDMTVNWVQQSQLGGYLEAYCSWFDGKNPKGERFRISMLEKR